jgi:hypothetical protein
VQVQTARRPVFSLLLACPARLLLVPCLSAIRYRRQNFASPLYVVRSPRSKLRSANPLDWWSRNLPSRDVPIDSRIAQLQLACSFACRVCLLHSGYTVLPDTSMPVKTRIQSRPSLFAAVKQNGDFIFQDRRFQPLTHSSVFNSNLIYRLAATLLHSRPLLLHFGARCSRFVAVPASLPTAATFEARLECV